MDEIKITECPRDAMQGIKKFIPTEDKIGYLQNLLKVGFDTLDCGSFVSSKVIPQLKDTGEVIKSLDLTSTKTKLLVIIANLRGAEIACNYDQINYLGFPFSISENFQIRNVNKTIKESVKEVQSIAEMVDNSDKELVVYLSMGFGNPYGDPWSPSIVSHWCEKLSDLGVKKISLSDTVGAAKKEDISSVFNTLIPGFSNINFGAHFHTALNNWFNKVDAAYSSGCNSFDGVINGLGGCPMATSDLIGNMPTEKLVSYFTKKKLSHKLNLLHFESALNYSNRILK
jgi:hydroxymethylglutaryl-CoA lyase